jgi:hypothetical protein
MQQLALAINYTLYRTVRKAWASHLHLTFGVWVCKAGKKNSAAFDPGHVIAAGMA